MSSVLPLAADPYLAGFLRDLNIASSMAFPRFGLNLLLPPGNAVPLPVLRGNELGLNPGNALLPGPGAPNLLNLVQINGINPPPAVNVSNLAPLLNLLQFNGINPPPVVNPPRPQVHQPVQQRGQQQEALPRMLERGEDSLRKGLIVSRTEDGSVDTVTLNGRVIRSFAINRTEDGTIESVHLDGEMYRPGGPGFVRVERSSGTEGG